MKKYFLDVYNILLDAYGPQNWWPTTKKDETKPSYNGLPLNDKSRFEIAVGAVLTQNTNWTNVEKAIVNLHSKKLLKPKLILDIPDEIIADAIRPSGYYNLKTKRLKSMTKWWLENYHNILHNKRLQNLAYWRDSILSVHGIGKETADSILLYCFDLPTFVIDAYTKRIMHKHFKFPVDISYEELRNLFIKNLPQDVVVYKEYHALLVELAKNTCKKNLCTPNCPLKAYKTQPKNFRLS